MAKFLGGGSSGAGKYFEIRSKLNSLRLTVSGGLLVPGTPVVTWVDHPGDNQVWYEDPLTSTLRSLQSHMCLHVPDGKHAVVDLYDAKDPAQRWRINKEKGVIENIVDPQKILEVEAANKEHGARLIVGQFADKSYQKWSLEFKPINYFHLSIEIAGTEFFLESESSRPKVGTKVVLRTQNKKTGDQELWYEDYTGNLKCKASEKLCLEGTKNGLVFGEPGEKGQSNFWVYIGNRIVNRHNYNEVAEVKCGRQLNDENKWVNQLESDAKNSDQSVRGEVSVGIYMGDHGQHFKQEYVK